MASTLQVDWTRIDDTALVTFSGLACVRRAERQMCLEWLRRKQYRIHTIDCSQGVAAVERSLGDLFKWEEQFGYSLTGDKRNLDALRDGFEFPIEPGGRQVLDFLDADVAWSDDRRWFGGVLAIAAEHSRYHLFLGSRFFTLLSVAVDSEMVGAVVDEVQVPFPDSRKFTDVEPDTGGNR